MPTQVNAFSNRKLEPFLRPDKVEVNNIKLTASTTYAAGVILGEVTASPGTYKIYASGSSDGSQVPKCILMYDCITDASSNVTYSTTGAQVGGDLGQQAKATPAYFTGTFSCADLTGLDANAVSVWGGARLESGSVSTGILHIG
jgi:hypothetical protein